MSTKYSAFVLERVEEMPGNRYGDATLIMDPFLSGASSFSSVITAFDRAIASQRS